MGTKDEEARRCFQNSKVTLRLAPMAGDEINNIHEKAGKVSFIDFPFELRIVYFCC